METKIAKEVNKKIGYPSSREKEYRIKTKFSKIDDVKFIQNNRKLFSRED